MGLLIFAVASLALQAPVPASAGPADSLAALRKSARTLEIRYERLVRRTAPVRLGGWDGTSCDEIVGRYCVRYDSPGDPPPPSQPEPAEVTDARRAAIEALRGVFSLVPGEFEVAGPLVRYLVEDGRAGEAVPAARLFHAVSSDSVWGPFLEGFALHATGRTGSAEAAFGEALGRLPDVERERILGLEWILEDQDRKAYTKLGTDEKRRFEDRFWRAADPLYLLPGNESRSEHLARHVWSRILERAPVVLGMQSWGSDLEQLTVRFGPPFARSRVAGRIGTDDAIVDHFDPRQMAFTPRDLLTDGVPPTPLPGRPWELARKKTRSGYSVRGLRSVRYLPHQVSRFPDGEGFRVRVDALFADSGTATHGRIETGFWLLDGDGVAVAEQRSPIDQQADTVRFSFESDVRPGAWVYAVEALDPADSAAARARYAFDVDPAAPGPRLSDPVILEPFRGRPLPKARTDAAFRPVADLTFVRADTVAVYVEGAGLTAGGRASLRLSVQPASRANLPARLLRWIGRRIGLAAPRDPVFVEWTATADTRGRIVLAFELPPQDFGDGDHVLMARLTDLATGVDSDSRRVIRFGPPES